MRTDTLIVTGTGKRKGYNSICIILGCVSFLSTLYYFEAILTFVVESVLFGEPRQKHTLLCEVSPHYLPVYAPVAMKCVLQFEVLSPVVRR